MFLLETYAEAHQRQIIGGFESESGAIFSQNQSSGASRHSKRVEAVQKVRTTSSLPAAKHQRIKRKTVSDEADYPTPPAKLVRQSSCDQPPSVSALTLAPPTTSSGHSSTGVEQGNCRPSYILIDLVCLTNSINWLSFNFFRA